ncbi:methanogen output domain 1-containing protein [Marinibaculum pumilum]|uniref:Methanogen output domain 1-containing protein n=1 Tax=Marinibaculum pumilum TaxID=1766165 RepID=A0ABV7KWC3_9PROT
MKDKDQTDRNLASCEAPVDRDMFLQDVILDLADTIQNVVGAKDAKGFISIVGARMGDRLNERYKKQAARSSLDRTEVAQVLVDLKNRIDGDFRVVEENDDRIVLVNGRCPFGSSVLGKPALCMMTSNVFGRIAAENLGYAHIVIEEAIALGHAGCRVVVNLKPDAETEGEGTEYFGMPANE